jgi:peroxiredoxin
LVQLREIEPQLKHLGVQVFAISPDQPSKLKETINKHQLGFPLLSDSDMAAARGFGVAYKLDEATLVKLKAFGMDVEEASGQQHNMLPVPAVFLIGGTKCLIEFEYVNPDYRVRISPELLLAAARVLFK